MNEERCETRKEGVDFLILQKKKKIRTEDWECPLASVLQKQQKRNISENIFAPQSLNTRSSRSVLITIQRRVVSRGARD
jgi:hypothetical protein